MKQIWKIVTPLIGKAWLPRYLILGIFSGACSFLFIKVVTTVVGLMMVEKFNGVQPNYILAFVGIILFFVLSRRALALGIIQLSQTLFWKLRKQLLQLVMHAGYAQFIARRDKVYAGMVHDVNTLTQASLSIIEFFTAVVLAVSCLIYLASISWILFLITVIVSAAGVTVYHYGAKKNNRNLEKARTLEDSFIKHFNSVLNGFKEIYMEPRKGKNIFEQKIETVSHDAYQNNIAAFKGFLNNQITGQILFYILIASILLFFGITLKIPAADTVSFVFTLLYLLSAIETIMVLLPTLVRAGVASGRVVQLKEELEQASFHNPLPERYISRDGFEQICIRNLEFYYGDTGADFGIGPINLDLQKGDTVFIYGGNGSGKTTFIHTLLGLCIPVDGKIYLNGRPVDDAAYPSYRTLFAVVFSDFYLFNELYGLATVDELKWERYLNLFEMKDKVKLEGNKFSTTDLSTGQRKRLALIAALMEDKPILVLDEWAADQDPWFRKKFYTEIVPALKQEGITIIAITHDDKYYHCADKLYKMDYGKLLEENIAEYH